MWPCFDSRTPPVAPAPARHHDAREFLSEEGLLPQDFKNKFQLCFEEALRNAVLHGNRSDFNKKVYVKVFQTESGWEVRVEDEGCGFCLDNVPDPLADDSLWGESGRGLHLMCHYMDLVNFYRGGRILVMTKFI